MKLAALALIALGFMAAAEPAYAVAALRASIAPAASARGRVRRASSLRPSLRSAVFLAGREARLLMMTSRTIRGRPVDERFIEEAVALRKQGKKQEEIAAELGVAQGTISYVLRKRGFGGWLSDNPDGSLELGKPKS
jgi:Uncharacterized membrane-associated protein/domain